MTDRSAVDESRPHEETPSGRSSIGIWAIVLVGPVTWISYFMVVYLAAEAVCTPARERGAPLAGSSAITGFVIAATAIASAVVGAGAVVAWRGGLGGDDAGRLHLAGLLLSIGSLLAIAAVGLPVLWLRPC